MRTLAERPVVLEPTIGVTQPPPERKRSGFSIEQLFWVIAAIGVVPRLSIFLENHALWLDEAMLALSITHRTLSQLTLPLDWNQAAPVGFLFLEKLSVMSFGNNEYVLRLVSIFSGIASLVAFRWLALKWLNKTGAAIAMILFALSPSLCKFSAQVKPYESDVAVALLLTVFATCVIPKAIKPVTAIVWGALGAVAVWFTFPSVLVLGGHGLTAAMTALWRKDRKSLSLLAIPIGMWLASFAAYYKIFLTSSANNNFLNHYWHEDFIPWSIRDCPSWFYDKLVETIRYCFGSAEILVGVVAVCAAVGLLYMLKRRRTELLIATTPIVMALFAALAHKYPFATRLIAFVFPALIILVAAGIESISQNLGRHRLVTATCLTALIVPFMMYWIRPVKQEDMRSLVRYIQQHEKPTDSIYVYHTSVPSFQYYAELFELPQDNVILGVRHPRFQQYNEHRTPDPPTGIASLGAWLSGENVRGKRNWNYRFKNDILGLAKRDRVWVVFAHVVDHRIYSRESVALYYLDQIGSNVRTVPGHNAWVYLYDMHKNPGPSDAAVESGNEDSKHDSDGDINEEEQPISKGFK
jgi:4-amino-4-deoxy-L-arabinose transferase-like glycosyltransferase